MGSVGASLARVRCVLPHAGTPCGCLWPPHVHAEALGGSFAQAQPFFAVQSAVVSRPSGSRASAVSVSVCGLVTLRDVTDRESARLALDS
eukprot:4427580-Prymnesium_polylepis.1